MNVNLEDNPNLILIKWDSVFIELEKQRCIDHCYIHDFTLYIDYVIHISDLIDKLCDFLPWYVFFIKDRGQDLWNSEILSSLSMRKSEDLIYLKNSNLIIDVEAAVSTIAESIKKQCQWGGVFTTSNKYLSDQKFVLIINETISVWQLKDLLQKCFPFNFFQIHDSRNWQNETTELKRYSIPYFKSYKRWTLNNGNIIDTWITL